MEFDKLNMKKNGDNTIKYDGNVQYSKNIHSSNTQI